MTYDERANVTRVEASIRATPSAIRIGGVVLPADATLEDARAALGNCEQTVIEEGGSHASCAGGRISLSEGSGTPGEIWIGTSS